jgi:hypothetical protein
MHRSARCDGRGEIEREHTAEEAAEVARIQAAAAARHAAEEAAAADRAAAHDELRERAQAHPDAALLARALGLQVGEAP